MSTEFKVLPKTGIQIDWYDTNIFNQLQNSFKAKRQTIQSPAHTKDYMRRKAVGTIFILPLGFTITQNEQN